MIGPTGHLNTRPNCPKCGKLLDGYGYEGETGTDEPVPAPRTGDVSVCLYCAAPLEYTDDGMLRWLDPDKFLALPKELQREITRTVANVRRMLAAKKREMN